MTEILTRTEPTVRTDNVSQHGDWVAMHIYYAANPQPLLVECVREVFARLSEQDLIDGYFYINYWLEGPHVRMRFRPKRPEDEATARAVAEDMVRSYLKRRPALYEVDAGFLGELYEQLFQMEFSPQEKQNYTAADGTMNLRPNNDLAYLPYEPEYGKYGGPAGIELAQWHFQHSSDCTIEVLRSMNLHLRGVLLGTSAQLMMVMSAAFLPDRKTCAEFLTRYHDFWQSHFAGTGFIADKEYEQGYEQSRESLQRQFAVVREAMAAGEPERLPTFLVEWDRHCLELHDKVADLAEQGGLTFSSWDGTRQTRVTDRQEALTIVLSPYMHMTNNRLHVTIRDEAYLAHLLGRVLGDARAESQWLS